MYSFNCYIVRTHIKIFFFIRNVISIKCCKLKFPTVVILDGSYLYINIGLLADAYLYQVELIKLFCVLIELCFATGYLTEKGFDRVFHLLVISIFIGISLWC